MRLIPERNSHSRRLRFPRWAPALFAVAVLPAGATADGPPPRPPSPAAPPGPAYGRQLPLLKGLGIGAAMDAAVTGNTLYVIGGGHLYAADITVPQEPKMLGKLGGLGNVRQIAVRGRVAYVTAREDGLFLIDVSRPERPSLLYHYDTIELATGIAVSGDVAFVACRFAGVELVDVSDPRRPVHLSTIRVGEAQSVTVRDGFLYAGVWASRELVVCDVRNPRRPSIVAKAGLDGYGDGVAVRGRYCYVATGHHAKSKGRPNEGDPSYGGGHGLEIFDVSAPARPRFVSRLKLPRLYRGYMDMWGVKVSGHYAFVADTFNGVFVIDVSDPARPTAAGHRQLPLVEGRGDPSPAAGVAVGRGHLYVAGAWTDLHVVAAPDLAVPMAPEPDTGVRVPPTGRADPVSGLSAFHPGGQVHAVAVWDQPGGSELILAAAGSAGLIVVRPGGRLETISQHDTEGFAFDVATRGDMVYVAEGAGGVGIWKGNRSGRLTRLARYRVPEQPVKQIVLTADGRFALLHVGADLLQVIELQGEAQPRLVLQDRKWGLFYRRPISLQLSGGGRAVCQWHASGLYEYEVSSTPRFTGFQYPVRVGAQNGAAPLGDKWLVTYRDKYFLLAEGEQRSPEELGLAGVDKADLSGKPSVFGKTLFVSNAFTGNVTAVDISAVAQPKVLGQLRLAEHPGFIVEHRGKALIPGGYDGLLVWDYRGKARPD